MKRRQVILLLLLVLVLSGCWVNVLQNPADPQYDSEQIAHAYSVQGDLMLLALICGPALLAGLVGLIVGQGRRK
jgi:hypothetical protein